MGAEQAVQTPESLNPSADAAKRAPDAQTLNTDNDATKKAGELAIDKEVLAHDPHAKAMQEAGFKGIHLDKAETKDGVSKSVYKAELEGNKSQVSVQLSDAGAKVELTTYDPVAVVKSKAEGDRDMAAEMIPDMIKKVADNYRKSRA